MDNKIKEKQKTFIIAAGSEKDKLYYRDLFSQIYKNSELDNLKWNFCDVITMIF